MSEIASPSNFQSARLGLRLGGTILTGAALLGMPVAGAVVGLTRPVHVEFAPGIEGDAQLHLGDSTVVDLGAFGGAELPRLHRRLPLIGNVANRLVISDAIVLPSSTRSAQLGLYSALIHNPQQAIQAPISREIKFNAVTGAAIGLEAELTVGVAGMIAAQSFNRRRRRQNLKVNELLADHTRAIQDHGLTNSQVDVSLQPIRQQLVRPTVELTPRRRRFLAAALALGVLTSSAAVMREAANNQGPVIDDSTAVSLAPPLVALDPKNLTGAELYGTGSQYLLNQGVKTVIDYKNYVDRSDVTINKNLRQRFQELQQSGDASYLENPNYTIAADISDLHCNLNMMQDVLPNIFHGMNVSIVMNTGDTAVSTGTLPFESDCVSTLGTALRPTEQHPNKIYMVVTMGNHDSNKSTGHDMRRTKLIDRQGNKYSPFVVLAGNDNSAKVEDFTFVGSSDPRQSISNNQIQPNSPNDQATAVAKQGSQLADTACTIQQKTGLAPILLSHDMRAAYASIVRGCVSLAASGHLHQQLPIQSYANLKTGITSYLFNQGTSSGVGDGQITEYASPKRDTPITMFVLDKISQRPIGMFNVMIHKNLSVDPITYQTLPTAPASTAVLDNYLKSFDPPSYALSR